MTSSEFVGCTVHEAGRDRAYHQGYALEEIAGHGRQATVYMARDLDERSEKHQLVAIKVFESFGEAAQHQAFELEGYRTARWRHPNILPTFSYGVGHIAASQATERPILVMPYMPEKTLRERLHKLGRLPLGEAVDLIVQATNGVEYAHQRKTVHRDLKPENFLIERRADRLNLLVADFGIALNLHDANDEATITWQVPAGSLPYIAPEQIDGKAVRESDIYSMAVIAYELMTGTLPFRPKTFTEAVIHHIYDLPPHFGRVLGGEMTSVHDALQTVILGGLAKRAADRPHNIGDFGQDIRDTYEHAAGIAQRRQVRIDLQPSPTAPADRRFTIGRAAVTHGPNGTRRFTEAELASLELEDRFYGYLRDLGEEQAINEAKIQELQQHIRLLMEQREQAVVEAPLDYRFGPLTHVRLPDEIINKRLEELYQLAVMVKQGRDSAEDSLASHDGLTITSFPPFVELDALYKAIERYQQERKYFEARLSSAKDT